MKDYKTVCRDYDVLLWESGLTAAPNESVWTFVPQVGDFALANDVEYQYTEQGWVKYVENE